MMTPIIGNMKQMAMLIVFGFVLVAIEVMPTTSSGLAVTVDVGVSKVMASVFFCDCSPAAIEHEAIDEIEAEADDNAKNDMNKVTLCHVPHGNSGNEHTITVGSSAEPAHTVHGDILGVCAGQTDADAGAGVVAAPCSCGGGTGYWTDSVGGSLTPPGGEAPKTVRQIPGL